MISAKEWIGRRSRIVALSLDVDTFNRQKGSACRLEGVVCRAWNRKPSRVASGDSIHYKVAGAVEVSEAVVCFEKC
jgi:hypothetical protein